MKLGVVALIVLMVVGALTVTVMVARSGTVTADGAKPGTPEKPVEEAPVAPPVSTTGPHPKVVTPESEFKFGSMALGQSRSHVFVVENQGMAPLKLVKGKTSCKCTLSKLKGDEILPGGKADVELTWEPKSTDAKFRQTATILTNDPEHRQFSLSVEGEVTELVVVDPPESWALGEIKDDAPTVVHGTISSKALEKFSILEVEGASELVKVEYEPFTEAQLTEKKVKSGYNVHVTLSPPKSIGDFNERFTLKTDINGDAKFPLALRGTRPGPLQILPIQGTIYHPNVRAVDLEEFDSAKGKVGRLMIFVSGMGEEEFKATKVESDTPFLKVELVRDAEFNAPDRQRFDLVFTVPPGSPALAKVRGGSSRVTIHTNHPTVEKLEFRVEMVIVKGAN